MKGSAYEVVHVRCPQQIHPGVIGPLYPVGVVAVESSVCSVKEVIILDESHIIAPIPYPLRPVCVGLIPRILGKPGGDIEENPVRDGVFVIIAGVEGKNLPPQSATTELGVPSQRLRIEHSLGEGQPLWLVFGRIWKSLFSSGQGGHGPEALIVVAGGLGLIGCHVIVVRTNLVKHALGDKFVVLTVTSVEVIVE